MTNPLNKLTAIIIFPSIFLAAAAFPLSCSISKDSGVFRSQDFGASWEQKVKIDKKQTIGNKDILSLAIDPVNPSILYLGTAGSGLYKSTDEAETWHQISDKNNVLTKDADIYDIKINSRNPNLVYLAVYQDGFGRVFVSHDSGESWQEIYIVSKDKLPVYAAELDRTNDGTIYIVTAEGGILKSLDYGSSWQPLGWFDGGILDIKIDPKNNQVIYLVTNQKGLQKSTDQGQHWQPLILTDQVSPSQFGGFIAQEKATNLLIDSRDSKIIYVVSEAGFWKSLDGGQTWRRFNILMPPKSVSILTIAQDEKNPSIIYYGAGSVVYRTNDAGQTWTVNQVSSSKKVKVIKIDPLDSNIIYVGMHS